MSVLATLFAAVDAGPATNSPTDWVAFILAELARTRAAGFVLAVLKWTVLGAALGAVVAVLSAVLFSRIGWYDIRWRFTRWLRWVVIVITVALSTILFGLMGAWEGAIRGSRLVLTQSQLATEVFPRIAEGIADGMAWVQIRASSPNGTNDIDVGLEAFRAGKWELNAPQFLRQLEGFKDGAVDDAIRALERSTLEHAPILKDGLGEILLHQFLNRLGRLMLEKTSISQSNSWGADRIYIAIRERLQLEAGKSGNPDTIARVEISRFVVHDGIVPGLMRPIELTARSQQLPLAVMALAVLILPPVCIRLGRRRDSPAQTPPPVIPGSPQSGV
jgi:hypothetical protein